MDYPRKCLVSKRLPNSVLVYDVRNLRSRYARKIRRRIPFRQIRWPLRSNDQMDRFAKQHLDGHNRRTYRSEIYEKNTVLEDPKAKITYGELKYGKLINRSPTVI